MELKKPIEVKHEITFPMDDGPNKTIVFTTEELRSLRDEIDKVLGDKAPAVPWITFYHTPPRLFWWRDYSVPIQPYITWSGTTSTSGSGTTDTTSGSGNG